MPYMTTEHTAEVEAKIFQRKYIDENDRVPQEYLEGGKVGQYTPSDSRKFISFVSAAGLGSFQLKREAGTAAIDEPGMMIPTSAVFESMAFQAGISLEQFEEDQMRFWQHLPQMFSKSAKNTKDQLAVGLYNLAFAADGGYADGRPLCDSNPPLYPVSNPAGGPAVARFGAYQSNYLGSLPPSVEALVQARILARTALDDRGKKDTWMVDTIVCPEALDNMWETIIRKDAVLVPYIAGKVINTQAGKWKKSVWRDLTSPIAWYVIGKPGLPGDHGNDCHGLGIWFRWNYKTRVWDDNATLSRMYMAYFRYAVMAWTYKRFIGSSGSSAISA